MGISLLVGEGGHGFRLTDSLPWKLDARGKRATSYSRHPKTGHRRHRHGWGKIFRFRRTSEGNCPVTLIGGCGFAYGARD